MDIQEVSNIEQQHSQRIKKAAQELQLAKYESRNFLERRSSFLNAFGLVLQPSDRRIAGDTGLVFIADRLMDAPQRFYFTPDKLDELVADENAGDGDFGYEDGTYLSDILPFLTWWVSVADSVALGDKESPAATPAFKAQRDKVVALLGDVLAAYPAAWNATGTFTDDSQYWNFAPHVELLRRYRLFTRYVCEFAQEVWPDVDFSKLRAQS